MALLNPEKAAGEAGEEIREAGEEAQDKGDKAAEIPGWLQKIEDKSLQEDPTLKRYKSEHELALAHVELRRKLGANPIAVPNEKDPPEKWDEFYGRLGRPESADKYVFAPPQGVEYDAELDRDFRLEAHRLGLSQKQFEGVNQWVTKKSMDIQASSLAAHNKAVAESEEALKKEWGGDYNRNLAIANAALRRVDGGGKILARLKEKGLDGDADMVRFFCDLGKRTMEESELKGVARRPSSHIRSRAQLEEAMKDKRYWSDPEYRKDIENGFRALYQE